MKYFFLISAAFWFSFSSAQKKPNILIILSDDHAYQSIGAYGSPYQATPNIDRLAKEGAVLENAYVTNSICGPSRAVLLTGKYSHKNGFRDNKNPNFNGEQNTFVKELKAAGYQTAWIGKWHLGSTPQGFDYFQIVPGQGMYFNPDFILMDGSRVRREGYIANIIEQLAEEWLASIDTSKPFCLIIGHKNTHRTWMPDTSDLRMFDHVNFPLPPNFYDDYEGRQAAKNQDMSISISMRMDYDLKMLPDDHKDGNFTRMNDDQRAAYAAYYGPIKKELEEARPEGNALYEWKYQRYMRDYYATAYSMDKNIGRMLDFLEKKGLTSNTMVTYMSDQGFYLGEHNWFDKRFIYEESFHTPVIIRYPGYIPAGSRIDAPVVNIDFAPTFMEAGGVTPGPDIQGIAFFKMLKGEKLPWRDAVYYHYYELGEHAVSPHFGIKKGNLKLIRFYKGVEAWEFFDLSSDPLEMHNLINDPSRADEIKKMKEELEKLILYYDDQEALTILKQN